MSLISDYALADGANLLSDQDPQTWIARDQQSKNRRQFTLWGRTANGGAAVGDVWGLANTIRALPTVAKTLYVVSDSAADAGAGTGAKTIRVFYLDAAFAEHFADFALNGTTPVTVATAIDGGAGGAVANCLRVQSIVVLTTGTGLTNAGNVTVNDSTQTYAAGVPVSANLVYGYLEAPLLVGLMGNISHSALWTTPAGYKAQIVGIDANVVDASATVKYGRFFLSITDLTTGLNQTIELNGDSSNSGGSSMRFPVQIMVDEKCDIRVQAIGLNAQTSEIVAALHLVVYPK